MPDNDHGGSSLFGPVTDADRRRWQIQSHAALATVLHTANKAGLAPLHWSLSAIGQLHATVPTLDLAQAEVREIYTAWADFLDLATRHSYRTGHGTVHLTAVGDIPGRDGRRQVGISADLFPDDDTNPATEQP
ncbi:hypothetical protein [Amycolatopsis sp. NPDC051128]|uniref:hypothetical protein n=1 Tax=Amycolatopsis sp. NPDC051128 TaxID=3155412 RepID=UPI00341C5EC7